MAKNPNKESKLATAFKWACALAGSIDGSSVAAYNGADYLVRKVEVAKAKKHTA